MQAMSFINIKLKNHKMLNCTAWTKSKIKKPNQNKNKNQISRQRAGASRNCGTCTKNNSDENQKKILRSTREPNCNRQR